MSSLTPLTTSPSDLFSLVGVRLEGKYDVHSVIAEGGFGIVYRATHRALQKSVAIKVLKTPAHLPDSARKEFIDKFVFEARTIARLEHPGIVRVLDFGGGLLPSGGAAPWIVLEWIDGQALDALLDASRGGRGRSPAESLALLRPIFEALAIAHDEGVAHRDLKPANVMLAETRQGVEPRLLDFGIAKSMADDEGHPSGATATRAVIRAFTLEYASPEQLGGTRTGPWTDVHALALLLVEVLTDRPPIGGDDNTALTIDALSPVRPTPAKVGLDVGPWEPILARALALRATDRYQHARDLLRALEASMPSDASWGSPGATESVVRAHHDAITIPRLSAAPVSQPPSRHLWVALAVVVLIGAFALAFIVGSARPRPMMIPTPAPVSRVSPPPSPVVVPPVPSPVATAPVQHVLTDAGPSVAPRVAVTRPARVIVRPVVTPRPTARERVPVE